MIIVFGAGTDIENHISFYGNHWKSKIFLKKTIEVHDSKSEILFRVFI
jgi:hypothetical protein